MKNMNVWTILASIAMSATSALAGVHSVKDLDDGAMIALDKGNLRLQVWSDDIIRVTYAQNSEMPTLRSLSVIGAPVRTALSRHDSARTFRLATSHIKISVDKATGAVVFADLTGKTLLAEKADGRQIAPATEKGITGNKCDMAFELPADEGIYGLGQHQQGTWNYRAGAQGGNHVRLAQGNTDVGIPVITSSRGYMLLWDNPAVTYIAAGTPDAKDTLRWSSESGKAIDYYFCYGDGSARSALKAYRQLTGSAPLMPKWMLGFWQCKERYASQQELLDVAKKLRAARVPVDGIIQDWQYWPPGDNTWGSHKFDPARYPDPAGMFRELHAMNYHVLISVWPKFDVGSANSQELNDAGGMFPEITTYVFPPGKGQWYDPFSARGREIYWKQIHDQIFTKGVDGWWLDAPEPEINNMGFRHYQTGMGPGYGVYNAYPLMHSTGIYQGQRAVTEDKRVVILTRSAYAGQQRNSAITWSGDIQGTWQVLRNQVPAGLNFSASGIPFWNTDTGGFFNSKETGDGDPSNPQFKEFFTRWFQFSAFCPMFRVHSASGTNPGREFYRFDSATQNILRTYLNLRYRLMPYLYSVAWQVTSEGDTFMRPLMMDFAGDPQVLNIGDQYLFGPAIMVAPVTAPGEKTRPVYLPAGATWYNFWTGESLIGGQRIETPCPVETIPLFVRSGSILPTGPFIEHTREKNADPIELRIYPGANGSFTLYEDEGDNYHYEKGVFATISFTWNDADKTLVIGQRKGEFPGMLQRRTFKIIWVRPGKGVGQALQESVDIEVHYDGKAVEVQMPAGL